MTPFETFLDKATAPGQQRLIPGCVVVAANKDGLWNAFGEIGHTTDSDKALSIPSVPVLNLLTQTRHSIINHCLLTRPCGSLRVPNS
jgi:hypothetical protein